MVKSDDMAQALGTGEHNKRIERNNGIKGDPLANQARGWKRIADFSRADDRLDCFWEREIGCDGGGNAAQSSLPLPNVNN